MAEERHQDDTGLASAANTGFASARGQQEDKRITPGHRVQGVKRELQQ